MTADRSNVYVLEFFLRNESSIHERPWPNLTYLLSIMKHKLKGFEVASGQQLGGELIIQHFHGMEHHPSRNNVHLTHKDMDSDSNVGSEEHEITDSTLEEVDTRNKHKVDKNKVGFNICYEDLQSHFGMILEEAAEKLGVSRSTLKRVCRTYGITRWPSNTKNKKSSLFQTKIASQNSTQQISIPCDNNLTTFDSPQRKYDQHSQELGKVCTEAKTMIIKARFIGDIIKFQLDVASGMEKLHWEVSTRLNLVTGSFKLKYLDEDDNDWILLTCDDDLHLCWKLVKSLGKTTVQVMVI